jgi:hypothetical protein
MPMREQKMPEETPVHETTTEARAGTGPGVMRYVLGASLVLVIIAFAVIVASGWMG